MRDVDSFLAQIGKRLVAESIAADAGDHGHGGAEPRRHDGLVGALAAVAELERAGRQRLAAARQPRRAKGEVCIDGADHTDSRSGDGLDTYHKTCSPWLGYPSG